MNSAHSPLPALTAQPRSILPSVNCSGQLTARQKDSQYRMRTKIAHASSSRVETNPALGKIPSHRQKSLLRLPHPENVPVHLLKFG